MSATLDDLRLLRPREAADLLGVSVRQLDRLIDAGVVRPVRLSENGNRRIRLRDLRELVANDGRTEMTYYEDLRLTFVTANPPTSERSHRGGHLDDRVACGIGTDLWG